LPPLPISVFVVFIGISKHFKWLSLDPKTVNWLYYILDGHHLDAMTIKVIIFLKMGWT